MSKSRVAWRTLNLGPKTSQASIRNTKSTTVQRAANSQCDLQSRPKFSTECSPIQHVPIKNVKICNAAEVKRKCHKEVNEENVDQPVVIVGNTLCLMLDAGVWGDADRAQQLVNMILKTKSDEDEEYEHELEAGECPPARKSESAHNFKRNIRNAWNTAVITVFGALANFPDNIIHYAVQYGESVTKKEEKALSEKRK